MSTERRRNNTNTKEPQNVVSTFHGSGKSALKIVKKDGASLGLGPGGVLEVTPLQSAASTSQSSSGLQKTRDRGVTPVLTTASISSSTSGAWSAQSPLHSDVTPEEKNIFTSLSLNPDALSKLEEVLTTTNEGQQMLQQGLGQVASDESRENMMDESQLSLKIDESAVGQEDMDFDLDESMIQGVLNAGNLSAMASAFSDHPYATAPTNSTPARADRRVAAVADTPKEADTSIDEGDSELNTSRNDEDDGGDDSQEDGRPGRKWGRKRKSGTRRSTRVQEISQRQEAKKIMEENLEKERAALENVRGLKPGDKIPVVKSYNMRGTRPRRDDGRIDYTKLAKGQGRVRVQDEDTREETDEGGGYEGSGGESVGGDSLISGNTDDSGMQASPLKIKIKLTQKSRLDSDEEFPKESNGSSVRGRGRARGRSRGGGGRGRGRGGTPRQSDDEKQDEPGTKENKGSSRRGSRGQTRGGRGRGRGKKSGVTEVKGQDESDDSDSEDDLPIHLLKGKHVGGEKRSPARDKPALGNSESEQEQEADISKVKAKSERRLPKGSLVGEGKAVEVGIVKKGEIDVTMAPLPSSDTEGNGEQIESEEDDDLPLNKLVGKTGKKGRASRYEEDSDFDPEVTQSSDEEAQVKDPEKEHQESVSPRKPDNMTMKKRADVYKGPPPGVEVIELLSSTLEEEDNKSVTSDFSTDEPNKLYCVCRKPWGNRFMICCEKCTDWFHGSCVGISEKESRMQSNKNWNCPRCLKELTKSKKKPRTKDKKVKPDSTDSEKVATKPKKALSAEKEEVKKPIKAEKRVIVEASRTVVEGSQESEGGGGGAGVSDDEDIQQTIDEIFGNSDAEEATQSDEKDGDFAEETSTKEDHVTKSKTANIVKKSEKNREKIEALQKQGSRKLENVKAKRERKEQREKEREIVELEKRKQLDRVEQAKRELKRRERERAKDAYIPARDRCIAQECKQRKLPDSVYCGPACIARHADQSLDMLREERGKMFGLKPQGGGTERIVVLERQSGKILTGPAAPTELSLKSWLEKHPSYEVLQPGQKPGTGSTALKKKESKEKEDKRREMQVIKEKRERRERDAAERRGQVKEQSEKDESKQEVMGRQANDRSVRPTEDWGERPGDDRNRRPMDDRSRRPVDDHIRRPVDDHSRRPADDPMDRSSMEQRSSGPDPLRINVRKALKEGLDKRSSNAEDIMLSGAEIKRIALDIEEELFNYYGSTSNKYRNKYRTILYYIRDLKNEGFFRRILNGRIKPYRLVRFNADQLGAADLARWRPDKPAVQDPLESGLKFEKFDPPVKPAPPLPTGQQTAPGYQKPKQHYEPAADILSSIIVDTTSSHKKHLFDVNCKICTGRQNDAPKVTESRPEKKQKLEQPLAVETPGYPGYGPKYYDTSPTSPASPAYPTAGVKSDLHTQHNIFGGDTGVGFYTGFYNSGKSPEEQAALLSQGHIKAESRVKDESHGEVKKETNPRDPRKKTGEASKREPQSGPVAEPLVDSSGEGGRSLPPGCVWMGHLYVQDMCNLQCTATPVSGPLDTIAMLSEMPDTISVVGRLSPPQIWEYLERLRNSTSRGIVVMTLQPQLKDTLNYLGLFEYLRAKGRCGLMAQYSQKVKDFYLVPLPSDSPVPQALMPFNGPGLDVNRPNLLLGVMVVLLSKKPKDVKPGVKMLENMEEKKPTVPVKTETEMKTEDVKVKVEVTEKPKQISQAGGDLDLSGSMLEEEKLAAKSSDLIVKAYAKSSTTVTATTGDVTKSTTVTPSDKMKNSTAASDRARSSDKSAKVNRETVMSITVTPSEANTKTAKVAEPKVTLAGSLPETLLQQLNQLKKPGTSKQEMAAAVVATLTANTQNKNIEEQKRLLAELTAKVEEQKKFLEKQKVKTQKPTDPAEVSKTQDGQKSGHMQQQKNTDRQMVSAKDVQPAVSDNILDIPASDIPLPQDKPSKPVAKPDLPQKDTGKEQITKEPKQPQKVKESLKSEVTKEEKIQSLKPIEPEQVTPVLSMSSLMFESKVETNAFNLARQRLLQKSEESSSATAAPPASLVSIPDSVKQLLSGSSFENLKNIVASVKDKSGEESGNTGSQETPGVKASDREEGEIDDEEIDIDTELEAAINTEKRTGKKGNRNSLSDQKGVREKGGPVVDLTRSETSVSLTSADSKLDSSQESRGVRERGSSVESYENRRDRRRRRHAENREHHSRDRSRDRRRQRSRSRDRKRHRSRSRDRHSSRRSRHGRVRSKERVRERSRERSKGREGRSMGRVSTEKEQATGRMSGAQKIGPQDKIPTSTSQDEKINKEETDIKQPTTSNKEEMPESENQIPEQVDVSEAMSMSDDNTKEQDDFEILNPSGDVDYRAAHLRHKNEEGAPQDWPLATMTPSDVNAWTKAEQAMRMINAKDKTEDAKKEGDNSGEMQLAPMAPPPFAVPRNLLNRPGFNPPSDMMRPPFGPRMRGPFPPHLLRMGRPPFRPGFPPPPHPFGARFPPPLRFPQGEPGTEFVPKDDEETPGGVQNVLRKSLLPTPEMSKKDPGNAESTTQKNPGEGGESDNLRQKDEQSHKSEHEPDNRSRREGEGLSSHPWPPGGQVENKSGEQTPFNRDDGHFRRGPKDIEPHLQGGPYHRRDTDSPFAPIDRERWQANRRDGEPPFNRDGSRGGSPFDRDGSMDSNPYDRRGPRGEAPFNRSESPSDLAFNRGGSRGSSPHNRDGPMDGPPFDRGPRRGEMDDPGFSLGGQRNLAPFDRNDPLGKPLFDRGGVRGEINVLREELAFNRGGPQGPGPIDISGPRGEPFFDMGGNREAPLDRFGPRGEPLLHRGIPPRGPPPFDMGGPLGEPPFDRRIPRDHPFPDRIGHPDESALFERGGHRFPRDNDAPEEQPWPVRPESLFREESDFRKGDARMDLQRQRQDEIMAERFRQGEDLLKIQTESSRDAAMEQPKQPGGTTVKKGQVPSLFNVQVSRPNERARDNSGRTQNAGTRSRSPDVMDDSSSDRIRKRPHREEETREQPEKGKAPRKKSRFDQPDTETRDKVTEPAATIKSSKETEAKDIHSSKLHSQKDSVKVKETERESKIKKTETTSKVKDVEKVSKINDKAKPAVPVSQKQVSNEKVNSNKKPNGQQNVKKMDTKTGEENEKTNVPYKYTKQDELQMTPGVLGPLLSMIRGGDSNPVEDPVQKPAVKQSEKGKTPASTTIVKTTKDKKSAPTNQVNKPVLKQPEKVKPTPSVKKVKDNKTGSSNDSKKESKDNVHQSSGPGKSSALKSDKASSKVTEQKSEGEMKEDPEKPPGWSAALNWSGRRVPDKKVPDETKQAAGTEVGSTEEGEVVIVREVKVKPSGRDRTGDSMMTDSDIKALEEQLSMDVDNNASSAAKKDGKSGGQKSGQKQEVKSVSGTNTGSSQSKTGEKGENSLSSPAGKHVSRGDAGKARDDRKSDSRERRRSRDRRRSKERRRSRSQERRSHRRSRSPDQRGREVRSFRERRFHSPDRHGLRKRDEGDNRGESHTDRGTDSRRLSDTGSKGLGWPNNESGQSEDLIGKQIKTIRARGTDLSSTPAEKLPESKPPNTGQPKNRTDSPSTFLQNPNLSAPGPSDRRNNVQGPEGTGHFGDRLGDINQPPPDYFRNVIVNEELQSMAAGIRGDMMDKMEQEFPDAMLSSGWLNRGPEGLPPEQHHLRGFGRGRARPMRRGGMPRGGPITQEGGEMNWREEQGMERRLEPQSEEQRHEGNNAPGRPSMGLLGDRPPSHGSFEGFPEGQNPKRRKSEEMDGPRGGFGEKAFNRDTFRPRPGEGLDPQQEMRKRFQRGENPQIRPPRQQGQHEEPVALCFEDELFRDSPGQEDRASHPRDRDRSRFGPPVDNNPQDQPPLHHRSFPPGFPDNIPLPPETAEDVRIVTRQDPDGMGLHSHRPPPPPGSHGLGSEQEAMSARDSWQQDEGGRRRREAPPPDFRGEEMFPALHEDNQGRPRRGPPPPEFWEVEALVRRQGRGLPPLPELWEEGELERLQRGGPPPLIDEDVGRQRRLPGLPPPEFWEEEEAGRHRRGPPPQHPPDFRPDDPHGQHQPPPGRMGGPPGQQRGASRPYRGRRGGRRP